MELNLAGKVALVTGASRGIGRAVARALAAEGCDIVAVARGEASLHELAVKLETATNRRVLAHAADLRAPAAAAAAVEATVARFGRLDILVNNAGATKRGDFFALTEADWDDGFALKLRGAVRLARAAWPNLKRAQGTVINVAGAGGRVAAADFTIGGAVNAALLNFTKALAQIGIRDGVRVNAILPGWIETDRLTGRIRTMVAEQGIGEDEARRRSLDKLGVARFGRPEEIGDLVCFLASDRADYVQGDLIGIDGGFVRNI